ncbi:glycosyltransferase family 2 protein [Limnohabitans sp. G3-2]|uniref:glycosyltransferase family 2 protein n=1 Tax=Limnohabitans sp. G3-2 TaxID=1100711 RepID=UPI000C1E46D4|nr:glycosyltransferase family 2 protein [Limnohabitans sp. G3-2]PIT75625.1 glycosyltransferase [Limnohabitans sp. G3-2]
MLLQTPPHRLSVVVPMFNEEELAHDLIDAVQAALMHYPHPWELLVVDDGSTDETWKRLRQRAQQVGPHIRIIRLLRNFRQTAAMQAGIDMARGDVIVTMDGDLQNDPLDIPNLVDKLLREDLDLVAGWRQYRQDGLFLRKIPSRLANRLIRRVSGLQFQDLGCSLKAFRTSVLRKIRLYGEMHRFIPAWMATVTSPDRMAELAVSHRPRTKGQSKYGISRTIRVLVDLLSIHFFLNFGTRPGHFFGGLGLLVSAVGTLILTYLAAIKWMGEDIGTRPLMFLGFFCIVSGLQFITTGVLSEMLMRTYFDGGQSLAYHTRDLTALDDEAGWYDTP